MKTKYQYLTTKIEPRGGVGSGGVGRNGPWECSKHIVNFTTEMETGSRKLSLRLLGMFVAKDNERWPIADLHVPSNDPRNTCGTHFGSSSPLVSKVAIKTLQ